MAQLDLLQEAGDPATDPERLRYLATHKDETVRRAAWRNPSLPEEVWRDIFLRGFPEAWANPMAPFYMLAWTSENKNDEDEEEEVTTSARWAAFELLSEPERCSPEGKALINAKLQEWWVTSRNTFSMMSSLGWWAQAKGNGSVEHREVVRITVLCVRTAPNLTPKDRRALKFLEAWCAGGEDRRIQAETSASSQAVTDTALFAQDADHGPENALWEVREVLLLEPEQKHMLADVIRREMPLPPVVD
jgi:hypothetical protein